MWSASRAAVDIVRCGVQQLLLLLGLMVCSTTTTTRCSRCRTSSRSSTFSSLRRLLRTTADGTTGTTDDAAASGCISDIGDVGVGYEEAGEVGCARAVGAVHVEAQSKEVGGGLGAIDEGGQKWS